MKFNAIKYTLLAVFLCANFILLAQTNTANTIQNNYIINISATHKPIKIDGILNEDVWNEAKLVSNFWKKYPTDTGKAIRQTTVKITYDNQYLYVAFICEDSGASVIQSLKRDFGHDGQDGVGVILDPFNQKTNGFLFVVNAQNAQSEDQLAPFNKPNFSWDCKWYSATKNIAGGGWIAEMAIPFKSIRFDAQKKDWGINFLRVDTKTNEYSCWTPVPINFASHDLGFTGKLVFNQMPNASKSNTIVMPYTSVGINTQENDNKIEVKPNAGVDAKIALNNALNLDITVNPDFSQVEVDKQITNLTRFNIFFPERRAFFLENADLLGDFGIQPLRPFYSRKIGLDHNNNPIPIIGGLRLSGNIAKQTRIGVLAMQTGRKNDYAPQNYFAATLHQRVLKRSSIKTYFLNREAFLTDDEKKANPLNKYGRNAGVEFLYTNTSGSFNSWATWHSSFKPTINNLNHNYSAGFEISKRKFNSVLDLGVVGTNYYTDMGYSQRIDNYDALRDTTIRVGYSQIFNDNEFKFFPKKGKINQHQIHIEQYHVFNLNNTINELNLTLKYVAMFKNASYFETSTNSAYINLNYPTSFTDSAPLPVQNYTFHNLTAMYNTDYRKKLNAQLSASYGGFYNGTNTELSAQIQYRQQHHFSAAINFQYNYLKFPTPYGSTKLFLISPKVEYNFTDKLFFTTFLQYNTQRNNFNLNSRLQWRYKPMSDMFLVYTDNYYVSPMFSNKNRALIFKISYWIN